MCEDSDELERVAVETDHSTVFECGSQFTPPPPLVFVCRCCTHRYLNRLATTIICKPDCTLCCHMVTRNLPHTITGGSVMTQTENHPMTEALSDEDNSRGQNAFEPSEPSV